jgi:uncharacterized membrane protein YqjE
MKSTAPQQPSVGELVSQLSEQASTLVRDELRLAQVELSRKARYAGMGAGLVGAAAVLAGLGAVALVAAAIFGLALDLALPAWLAALLVGAALLGLAGACAIFGKREIAEALPPVPQEALSEVKADLRLLKR